MISVPFLGLIGAIIETGRVYFLSAQLQMATETAGRAILVHSTASGMTYQQFINNYVCTWQSSGSVSPGTLSTMFDCSQLLVDVSSPASWGNADTNADLYNNPNPGSSVINPPGPGQIAIVRIMYPLGVIAGFLGGEVFTGNSYGQIRTGQTQYNGAWTYMIMGVAAFRVEPG